MKIIERNASSSNLKIILAPRAGAESVTGIFAVRAGSKYETTENKGIAHFWEHMSFKGTQKRPTPLDITKEIEGRGGDYNAFTSKEMTWYYIKILPKYLEVVCDVLSDILLNSVIDPAEIEKEKGVIVQEIMRGQDDPENYVISKMWPELLYGDQPAGWDILGTEESVKAMTRENFTEFLGNLYTDENAVFCLAGKISDEEKAFAAVSNFFCGIRKGKLKIIKQLTTEKQEKPALLVKVQDTQQSHIVLGVRACNIFDPRKYIFQVLDIILGGNTCSRLFTEIREKRGLAYGVYSFLSWQSDIGYLATSTGVNKEKAEETVKVIIDECKKLCDAKVSDEELQRAKDCLISSSKMDMESSYGVASFVARQWVYYDKIFPLSEIAKKIEAVTAEDVQTVAREIFIDKGLNLAIIGPHAGMEEEFLKILKF